MPRTFMADIQDSWVGRSSVSSAFHLSMQYDATSRGFLLRGSFPMRRRIIAPRANNVKYTTVRRTLVLTQPSAAANAIHQRLRALPNVFSSFSIEIIGSEREFASR